MHYLREQFKSEMGCERYVNVLEVQTLDLCEEKAEI